MSHIIASKAPVCVSANSGYESRQYRMDLTFEENTFHCKLSSAVRLATSQKVFVYLVLNASQVQDIVVCDVNHIAPPDIVNTFVKQGCCTTQADIMSIRFTLKAHAPLVTPTLALEKRPSSRSAIDALLRLGQCETFEVHVPTGSMKQERLSDLCTALASRALKPSPTEVLKGLYAGSGIKTVTHVDELWPSDTLDRPPAYDEATVAGASTHESSVPSNTRFWRSPTARGKRQISPEPRVTPMKRHALSEKATPMTWEAVVAAQAAQLNRLNEQIQAQAAQMAAYDTQLEIMREEMQQLRRPLTVNTGSQTEPTPFVSEYPASPCEYHSSTPVPEYHPSPARPVFERCSSQSSLVSQHDSSPAPCLASASQASTVEITIEDRLIILEDTLKDTFDDRLVMLEDALKDEQRIRETLKRKIGTNDQRIKEKLDVECSGLEHAVTELESRLDDLENDLKDNLRNDLSLELQIKLEDFIEFRLEDVEEVVKNDLRMAIENATYNFKMELNWPE